MYWWPLRKHSKNGLKRDLLLQFLDEIQPFLGTQAVVDGVIRGHGKVMDQGHAGVVNALEEPALHGHRIILKQSKEHGIRPKKKLFVSYNPTLTSFYLKISLPLSFVCPPNSQSTQNMRKTHIFDQKNNPKTISLPTYLPFFFRPLQETNKWKTKSKI